MVPAKVDPSVSQPIQHYQRKSKRSLPPLSSLPQAKKKISTGITLAKFTPYSNYFCYNDNARDMKLYEGRNIIPERNFDVLAHQQFMVFIPCFKGNGWPPLMGFLDTLTEL